MTIILYYLPIEPAAEAPKVDAKEKNPKINKFLGSANGGLCNKPCF
jgi:hypothetical protein